MRTSQQHLTRCSQNAEDFGRAITSLEERYRQSKRNRWLGGFAVSCRIVLALGFIPAGIVKVMGERFSGSPNTCQHFCDCIYNEGNPLSACVDEYERAKQQGADRFDK